MESAAAWLRTSAESDRLVLAAGGSWTVRQAAEIDRSLRGVAPGAARSAVLDLSQLTGFDTAGAWLIRRTMRELQGRGLAIELHGLAETYLPLLRVVETAEKECGEHRSSFENYWRATVERIGQATVEFGSEARALLTFYGMTILGYLAVLRRPRSLRMVSLVNQIEQTGLNAIPIVCLLSFLIGIVIACGLAAVITIAAAITLLLIAIGVVAWFAALTTAAVMGGIAYAFAQSSLAGLRRKSIAPVETIHSLKETTAWLKNPSTR